MYSHPHYIFVNQIRNPGGGLTTYVTSTHLVNKEVFLLEHIIPIVDNIINPRIILITLLPEHVFHNTPPLYTQHHINANTRTTYLNT